MAKGVVLTGTLWDEKELADRVLGFKIAVRGSGILEGIGAVDEHIQRPVFDPVHHLQCAPAPLFDRFSGPSERMKTKRTP